jgi:hypothetical protein
MAILFVVLLVSSMKVFLTLCVYDDACVYDVQRGSSKVIFEVYCEVLVHPWQKLIVVWLD